MQSIINTNITAGLSFKKFGTLFLGSRSNLSSHPTRQTNAFEQSRRLERYHPRVSRVAHDSCAYLQPSAIACYTYVRVGSNEMVRHHGMQNVTDLAPYNTRI